MSSISRGARGACARLLLAALAAGCSPARPAVSFADILPRGLRVSIDESFYAVGGVTAPELNRELGLRGPMDGGRRWYGRTDFRVAYRFVPRAIDGGCRADEPEVRVTVVTTLPMWTDRASAPAPLRADWDLFLDRLREHERGHQRLAVGTGEELLQEMAATSASDCDALVATTRRLAGDLQSRLDVSQRGFDDHTAHGVATDG